MLKDLECSKSVRQSLFADSLHNHWQFGLGGAVNTAEMGDDLPTQSSWGCLQTAFRIDDHLSNQIVDGILPNILKCPPA